MKEISQNPASQEMHGGDEKLKTSFDSVLIREFHGLAVCAKLLYRFFQRVLCMDSDETEMNLWIDVMWK